MSARTLLAAVAAVAALLAAFAGSPFGAARAAIDVDRLAAAVAHEEDHVTALALAEWIRDRKPGLRIVDLRSDADFDQYHVPGSERVPIEALSHTPFRGDETIVLISEGGGHAAQAWVFLQARGYPHVYFMRGGLDEWMDDVMNPTLAVDATPAETAAFARVSAISRYFGGVPRVTGKHTTKFDSREAPEARSSPGEPRELRRRGC